MFPLRIKCNQIKINPVDYKNKRRIEKNQTKLFYQKNNHKKDQN